MRFADRQPVEATWPVVYIGRRVNGKGDAAKASRWYYAEWSHGGRTDHQALGTTNKQTAIRKAHDICRRVESGEARPRTWKVTIGELVDQYLQLKRDEGLAAKTIAKYENDLGQFRNWVTEEDIRLATAFDERAFRRFGRVQRERGYHGKTCYSRMVLVKQLFKWGWDNKLLPDYGLRAAKLKEPASDEQPCFTPHQVATLLAAAPRREAAIYATLAYAGLRIGEARELRWSNVMFDVGANGFLVVRRGGSSDDAGGGSTTKNRKVRRLPIHGALLPYLEALPRTDGRVFTAEPTDAHPEHGRPISERLLLVRLKRLCKQVGFEQPQRFKLHTFRHAFASMCARNNVSYKYALSWMGHSSSEILDLYYSMYDKVAEQAMATIDYAMSPVTRSSDCAEAA